MTYLFLFSLEQWSDECGLRYCIRLWYVLRVSQLTFAIITHQGKRLSGVVEVEKSQIMALI